jgi:hypothetical protein
LCDIFQYQQLARKLQERFNFPGLKNKLSHQWWLSVYNPFDLPSLVNLFSTLINFHWNPRNVVFMHAVLFPKEHLPAASKEDSSWLSTRTTRMLGDGCQTGHGNWAKSKDLHPMSSQELLYLPSPVPICSTW